MATLRFTILGCGSSGGVPRLGGHWGACDPNNPKNIRRRCSLLVDLLSIDIFSPNPPTTSESELSPLPHVMLLSSPPATNLPLSLFLDIEFRRLWNRSFSI